jgi:serine/threonine protein kinase
MTLSLLRLCLFVQLDHPNVIKLYEVYEDLDNIFLVLEYCSGGELYDRLHAQEGRRYGEAQAARLVFKMLTAIAYCHGMGISHRDLKYARVAAAATRALCSPPLLPLFLLIPLVISIVISIIL